MLAGPARSGRSPFSLRVRHLAARPPTTPPPWRTPKPPERSAAEERAAAENAVIERLQQEKQQNLEARVRAYEADPSRHELEQRDYLLGVTSLWMLVPAAHGLVGLGSGAALVSALQAIGWHGNPFFLPPAEFEAVRQAALLVCLLPTCTVSTLSWRYPHWDAMADADRLGAKTFFVSLLAGNLPGFGPLPTQEAVAFPLVTFSVFGLSALSENLGHPIGRTWSHAAFRCAGGWWAFASLAPAGMASVEPWYAGVVMAAFWGHAGWTVYWTGKDPAFRCGEHYVRGCAIVAVLAAAAVAISPGMRQ